MEKKSLFQLYKKSLGDLWLYKKQFTLYQLLTKSITLVLLLPLMGFVLNNLMVSRGYGALTNGLITKFLLSPQGFLSLLFIFIMASLVVLLELGGLIILSANTYFHRKVSISHILKTCFKKAPKMLGVGGLFVVLLFMVLSPWLDLGLNTSLIGQLRIPGFILDHIYNNTLLNILLKTLTVVLAITCFFIVLSLHYVILGNRKSFQAIRESVRTIKKNLLKVLGWFAMMTLLNFIIFIVIIIALTTIMVILLYFSKELNNPVSLLFLVTFFTGLFSFGASFILTPLQIHQLTYLYYQFTGEKDSEVVNTEDRGQNKPSWKARLGFILLFIGGMAVACVLSVFVLVYIGETKYSVEITAHRGSSMGAPENTMVAVQMAIDNKADYTEIDVQETKDGGIVLTHDTNLVRVTGVDVNVYELTTEEVTAMDAGSWFSEKFKGETIPTLEQVMDASKGKIKLNIELKGHKEAKNLVHNVVKLIKDKGMLKDCVITSLDYELVQAVEEIAPEVRTGYIMYVALGDLASINTDFYSIEASNVTDKFVAKAHEIGRQVHVWTVNDIDSLSDFLDKGVDNIITDNEVGMRQELEDLNQLGSDLEKAINNLLN